jgi:hypothetical protein
MLLAIEQGNTIALLQFTTERLLRCGAALAQILL